MENHCGATVWSNTVENNSCESSQRNVLGTYSGRTGNVHFLSIVTGWVGMKPRGGGSKREKGGGGTSRRKDEARTPAKASQKHEHTFLIAVPIENVPERRSEEFC